MSRRMFRYTVPADDGIYTFNLTGNPVAVAATPDSEAVEFWAEHDEDTPAVKRAFCVFGTGHPIYGDAKWVGTSPRTALGLVWHLYEVTMP